MLIISHRGNLHGPNPDTENDPICIQKLLDRGITVEVDVRFRGGWWLGHDRPERPVEKDLLMHQNVWCHAKDPVALCELLRLGAHCFWHDQDDHTLTSKGFIWTHFL